MESLAYARSRRNHLGTLGTCRFRAEAVKNLMASSVGSEWWLPIAFAEFRHSRRRISMCFNAGVLARNVHSIDAEGDSKMIRIQTANNPGGITIAIDGQLAGEYVEEVETSIRKAIEQHKDVHLFLRDVSHIDESGHSLLSRLAAQGVELSAAGLYSSYVVTQIQRALSSPQSREK